MNLRVVVLGVIAILAMLPYFLSPFYVVQLCYVGIATLATLGVVLVTGIGGMLSFGQAAFLGTSAYTTGILTAVYGLSPWLSLPVAAAVTLIFAYMLGRVTLGLSGHYLPLATIAWTSATFFLYENLEFFGQHTGIGRLPTISVGTIVLNKGVGYYYLVWLVVLLCMWVIVTLLDSRVGRAMRLLRAGRELPAAVGIDRRRYRMAIFLLAALMAAFSGWLFAHLQQYVSSSSFGLRAGIEFLFMAVIGGAEYLLGALLGAMSVIWLKHGIEEYVHLPSINSGSIEPIVFGIIVILMIHRAANGLASLIPELGSPVSHSRPEVTARLSRRNVESERKELLSVSGVSKSFGGLQAVDNISLHLGAGEIVALIGPNGAGKSTTFDLIAGTLTLSSGTIELAGRKINGLVPEEIVSRGLARTFQHAHVVSSMSVLENVAVGAHLRGTAGGLRCLLGLDRFEEDQIISEAYFQLEKVGLVSRAAESAGVLPLGELRLLEVARALSSNPSVLILDEPAAGLRAHEKEKLAVLLRGLRSQGMALLIVEHDMDFVMNLVDRIVVMSFGKQIAHGTPSEIRSNRAVIDAYLGEEM